MNFTKGVFYWHTCHVCKSTDGSKPVFVCGRCKLIYYCGKSHQKIHWVDHKVVCNAVNKLLNNWEKSSLFHEAINCSNVKEWSIVRTRAALLIELSVGRKLTDDERQMFHFPRVCEVCKEYNHKTLFDCQLCHCVTYCSKAHEMDDFLLHQKKCSSLKLCQSLDLVSNVNNSLHSTIYAFLRLTYFEFPQDMDNFLSKFITSQDTVIESSKLYGSELLSCPLTLVYAVKKANFPVKNELKIHIVGASSLECTILNIWEIVLHCLSEVTKLHLVFIGPEIGIEDPYNITCTECTDQGKYISLEFHNCLYHDYIKKSLKSDPDIIVTYNSGMHEYEESDNDTWLCTLPYFVEYHNTLIIFTSYTMCEAHKDMHRFRSLCKSKFRVVISTETNPFSSKRPHRNWETLQTEVFYINNFLSVVKSENQE